MTNDRLAVIESALQQLVAGQATYGARLDTIDGRLSTIDGRLDRINSTLDGIDGRLDTVDGRLDTLESGQETLRAKVDMFTEAQTVFEQDMTRQFNNLRQEFDRRLVPVEIAVRRIAAAAPGHNGRPSGPRKRTPRR